MSKKKLEPFFNIGKEKNAIVKKAVENIVNANINAEKNKKKTSTPQSAPLTQGSHSDSGFALTDGMTPVKKNEPILKKPGLNLIGNPQITQNASFKRDTTPFRKSMNKTTHQSGGASPSPTTDVAKVSKLQGRLSAGRRLQRDEAKEKARVLSDPASKSINYYYSLYEKSGFKNDIGIYKFKDPGKKAREVPIASLSDEQISRLVNAGVFDFEKLKKNGYSSLASYIQTKYDQYNYNLYNKDEKGIGDNLKRAGKFLSKIKDSAGDAIEGMSRGIVNAGASVVDLVSDNPKIDKFIENNTVKNEDDYKYEFMPKGQKTAAELIGSSAQLIPVIATNAFVPGAGMALLGTSVYGNSYREAKQKGASEGQAVFNGLLNAAAEVIVEKIAGGIPGLPKGVSSKLTENAVRVFKNSAMQKFARVLFEAGGEGTEEVLTYLAAPIIDKITKIPGAKIDYDIEEAAYNWLGGFVGSTLFSGGAVIAGYDLSPAPEAYDNAKKAVNEFKKSAFHNGINDAQTQKALAKAQKAIENASFYDSDNQRFEIPQTVAELISAAETVKRNPNTAEAQELIERYSGVGKTEVVKNDIYNKLIKDKKISRREAAAMDGLAYDWGVNINFVDIPYSVNGRVNEKFYNGEYTSDGRTINININSKDPLFEVVLEESAHAMARGDGNAFDNISGIINSLALSDEETFAPLYEDIIERYKGQMTGNEAHDTALIYSEFTSRMLSVILDNPQTLKNLARRNMNVFQKAADSILGFFDTSIKRYKTKDYGQNGIYADAAEKLEEYRNVFSEMFEDELDGYYRGLTNYNEKPSYSIITLENGMKYVKADEQVITSDNPDDWESQIINYVNKTVRNNQDIEIFLDNGDSFKITGRTAWKLGDRGKYDDTFYLIKGNASGVIDEIISSSSYKKSKPPLKEHRNNFAENGFEYRKAFFEDLDGKYYQLDISIGLNSDNKEVYNIGDIVPTTKPNLKIKKEDIIPRNRLNGLTTGEASSINSLPRNSDFDNTNINENDTDNLGNLNSTIRRIFTQGRLQYGLEPDVVYDDDISLTQMDIDQRLGREFTIPDEKTLQTQTDVKDMKNNSLHFADNVVFTLGEGADISYGTGRILDFVMRGDKVNAIVAVDSGDVNLTEVEVPTDKLIFTSHNNNNTISEDFRSSNSFYERAKAAYDNRIVHNSEKITGFSFADAQSYLITSSERFSYLINKIRSNRSGYDEGIATSHNLNPGSDDFEFDKYSRYELGLQLYDAVVNYNMAQKIAGLYSSEKNEFVGIEEIIEHVHDTDNMFSFVNSVYLNGNYMFNDLHRNFERVFGNYYDVIKPLLDNFDRAKGIFARNIFAKAEEVSSVYAKNDIEIGSIEDAAVQMLGEGNAHFDFKKKKHRELFKKFGFDESLKNGDTADVVFNFNTCAEIFGEEKALQIKECADYFRTMYDEYLVRANEVISRIYPGQEDRLIHPRKDYFRHFSEIAEGMYGVAQIMADDIQIDPKLVGKTDRTKPNRSWESIWQERKSKDTDYSAFKGFAEYIPHAEYTININPFIKEFRELGQLLADAKARRGMTDLNSFLNYIDKFSNHLAKKTVGLDRILTDTFGRDGRRFLNGIAAANNVVMKNAILGNISVSIKQILNLKNGLIYLQKPSLLINSTAGLLKAYTEDGKLLDHYEELMKQSDYLAERFLNINFADRKSGARRIAEKMASIGDEFAVRAVWLAAYEDGVNLKCDDPVRYADDIARRCSAGRGIGEKPLIFTQQVSKLVLPFLLENNNNWNVLKDAFGSYTKTRKGSGHEFSDTNSYSYYKNRKSETQKFISNSFKLTLYLLATAGIGELIEELTGYQAEFNPINDFVKGFRKAVKDNGELDYNAFCDGMINSLKNLGSDFMEHRNLSSVYSMVLSYCSDNPLSATNDFFGSVPVISAIGNTARKAIKNQDYIGAGLEFATSFLTPYGGNQLKKSINGGVDFIQGGNYKNAPTKQLQNKLFDSGAIYGEKMYEIEKTPQNFMRGVLFGQSAFPESREYYESRDENKEQNAEQAKIEEKAFDDFRKSVRGPEYDEFLRVYHKSDNQGALPYRYISPTLEFTSESGKEYSFTFSDEQLKKYQDRMNREAKKKYLEVSKTEKYKKASDVDKAKMLSSAGSAVYTSLLNDMKKDVIGEEFVKEYTSKYGEDEVIKAYKRSGYDSNFVPHYEFSPNRTYTINGVESKFSLSDDELGKYSELADEEIRTEYKKIISDPIWYTWDNEKRSEKLAKAKEKVRDKISEYIKWDYVYRDAMEEFDAAHGEDNPVRKAYEYSHDATVYPYLVLDSKTVEFTENKKKYVYELSDKEYESINEQYNAALVRNYSDNAIGKGYTKGLSSKELYEHFMQYKKDVMKFYNKKTRNYAREKLGFPESTWE